MSNAATVPVSEVCGPCRDAGFPNVCAHYKGVSKGMSGSGKMIPPMCFDHKQGRVPKFIQAVQGNGLQKLVDDAHEEVRQAKTAKSAKWTAILERLVELKIGESAEIELPPDSGPNAFRSILYQSKLTQGFRWSVNKLGTGRVKVTPTGKFDSARAATDDVESRNRTWAEAKRRADEHRRPEAGQPDGNDYTPLTPEQIKEIHRLKGEGFTITEMSKRVDAKPWRVQQAAGDVRHSTAPEVINRMDKNPYDGTHMRAEAIIQAPVMTREQYEQRYGRLGLKQMAQSTLDMWKKIEELAPDSVLILPMKEQESTNAARSRYHNLVARCIRAFKPKFKVRLVAMQAQHHVVLVKHGAENSDAQP